MRSFILTGSTTFMIILLAGCSRNPTAVHSERISQVSPVTLKVSADNNRFGIHLFQEISDLQPGINKIISPLSVSMALGMTLNGANGETEQAMKAVLKFEGLSMEEINRSYRELLDLMISLDPAVVLQLANSIWYEQSLHFEQDFMDNCTNYFDAQLRAINFDNPDALPAVNDWVNEKTQGKIATILDELPPNVVMILLNAIYFKGIWTYQFDSTLTVDDRFRLSDGSTQAVRMMTQKVLLPYSQTDEFQAIDLPYGSGDFRMTIFLPQNGNTIDGLIDKMTPDLWGRWIAALEADSVNIQMPRFKLEYKLKMNDVLTAMGMGIAFDRYRADFSGMCRKDMIWIDQVMHKSFIEVNEQGTEAAAATAVVMVDRAVMDGPPLMRIDHPFLFTIRESKTNTMLFIGAVENPGA